MPFSMAQARPARKTGPRPTPERGPPGAAAAPALSEREGQTHRIRPDPDPSSPASHGKGWDGLGAQIVREAAQDGLARDQLVLSLIDDLVDEPGQLQGPAIGGILAFQPAQQSLSLLAEVLSLGLGAAIPQRQ